MEEKMKHGLGLLIICVGAVVASMTGPNVGLGEIIVIVGAGIFIASFT